MAVLLALTGCGDPQQAYCRDLESQAPKISDMIGSDSPTAVLDGLPLLEDLAGQAPEDLRDEWQTLLGSLRGLDEALHHAGVKGSDFKDGKPPSGLPVADQKAIAEAADQLASEDVVQASSGIEQQARDVCKVNLGL